jgi:hypothetical protein
MVLLDMQVDAQVGQTLAVVASDGKALPVLAVTPGTGTPATAVTFTPSNPGVWPLPVPTTVQQALDALAALNGQQQQNAAIIGPLATTTFTTAPIVSSGSGMYVIIGTIAANASGVSTQAGFLQVNGANVATSISGTGGAGPFDMTMIAVAQLARGSSNTFGIGSTASAGTNTIPATLAKLVLLELD